MTKKKKTPSKVVKEDSATKQKQEMLAIAPKKKQTPSKAVKEDSATKQKEEKPAIAPKKKCDELDEIFASKKRKKPEAEVTQKPENVNGAPNKDKEKKKKKRMISEDGPRRKTNDGFKIFRSDELGINKPGSGFTSLCPFDCSCCF